jgi:pyruvate formate lyase activating enzyme
VAGHTYENTFCPKCQALLIDRSGFSIVKNVITENKTCPECGYKINIK